MKISRESHGGGDDDVEKIERKEANNNSLEVFLAVKIVNLAWVSFASRYEPTSRGV
jgi:hypothetical protein